MAGKVHLLRALLIISALALANCGPTLKPPAVSPHLLQQEAELQQELLLKSLVDHRVRLHRIYTPLRLANAELCGTNLSPVTGMVGIDRLSLPQAQRRRAEKIFGLTDGVKILDIIPGSPAAESGIKTGDVVTGAAKGAGVIPSGWT